MATSGDLLYGPISGYTAKLAAFADHLSLDKGEARDGYCGGFYWFRLSLRIALYREGAGSKLSS
ncbi:MAG: hypothetical protein AB7P69_03250 [Candidatus Binatia bacterium]